MNFLPKEIDDYAVNHSEKEPKLLADLNRETHLKILQPRMLSGAFQGRVLSMISKLIRPKKILEIGTYTGYSAICLAEGLAKNGEIHTIDINEELEPIQTKYFKLAGFDHQIKRYVGNALEIIPELNLDFDLVFIDADKENYINYFNLLIDKLPSGSVILSDNVLWSGKVLEKPKKDDSSTATLIKYNELIANDNRIESVLLPIRDGLTISRKI